MPATCSPRPMFWTCPLPSCVRSLGTPALLSLLLMTGCVETRVIHDGWADFFLRDPEPSAAAASYTGQIHTVRLARFTGANRHQQAHQAIGKLYETSSLDGAWVEEIGPVCELYYGRFPSPEDPRATRALATIRQLRLDGRRPYRGAQITALQNRMTTTSDPLDVRQHVGYHTLQIGFYDAEFGPHFRQAAEEAAGTLRAEGHEAYFYHGPHRSLVTLGLFTRDDFVSIPQGKGTVETYGPRIRALQVHFPHTMINGRTVIDRHGETNLGERPTFIVRVF